MNRISVSKSSSPLEALTSAKAISVLALAIGHETSLLAIGAEGGTIYVSHRSPTRATNKYQRTFFSMKLCNLANTTPQWEHRDCGWVHYLAFANHDSILVSASPNGVRTWNVETGAPLRTFRSLWKIRDMLGSPSHPLFVSEGTLYNAEDGSELSLNGQVTSVTFKPDGNSLIVGSGSGGLATWDLKSLLEAWGRRPSGRYSSLAVPAIPLHSYQLQASTTSSLGSRYTEIFIVQGGITALSVSSDGLLAASGSSLPLIMVLWDLLTGHPVMKMQVDRDRAHRDTVWKGVSHSPRLYSRRPTLP